MFVISPHLDDAVFGCGQWLAAHPGTTVVTVFAGIPPRDMVTDWDRRCGFVGADQAMRRRRDEDTSALAVLHARPLWLPFLDAQYGETPALDDVAAELRRLIDEQRPETVLFPLGLHHADHLLAHDASVRALRDAPPLQYFAYEDALYRGLRGELQRRLAALAGAGIVATPVRLQADGPPPLKARAVQTYQSQLRGLGPEGYREVAWPERYWRLEPAEADAAG